jgi:hypothetical protein
VEFVNFQFQVTSVQTNQWSGCDTIPEKIFEYVTIADIFMSHYSILESKVILLPHNFCFFTICQTQNGNIKSFVLDISVTINYYLSVPATT